MPSIFKERLLCPVCSVWLGDRYKDELYVGHCEECKATFTWYPKSKKPKAILDSCADKHKCGCGGCGR